MWKSRSSEVEHYVKYLAEQEERFFENEQTQRLKDRSSSASEKLKEKTLSQLTVDGYNGREPKGETVKKDVFRVYKPKKRKRSGVRSKMKSLRSKQNRVEDIFCVPNIEFQNIK